MLNDSQIETKYKIVFVDKHRYYYEDLSKRDYSLETTTPFSLEFNGKSFLDTSWKQLLLNVFTELLKDDPTKKDELLKYKMHWNGKYPFSSQQGKHYYEIGEGIYLLCNQSALHACWLLREVLQMFDVDLSKCGFIIHRPPYAEPYECRKFYEEKTRNAFKYYYINLLGKTEEKADRVLRNIDKLNKLLAKFSKAYDNFYLIDNNGIFASYKAKFVDHLLIDLHIDAKNVVIADQYLTILGDFYKVIY